MPMSSGLHTGSGADLAHLASSRSPCDARGFHGPFETTMARDDSPDVARCAKCGKQVAVAEHLPAYQIARFHGLVP
jgi:hypothetical protein